MDWLTAFGHFAGSFLLLVTLEMFALIIADRLSSRLQTRFAENLAVELGVPKDDLQFRGRIRPDVVKVLAARFSSELFRNRISDVCGWLRSAWDLIGIVVVWGTLLTVLGFMLFDNAEAAILAWAAPVARFFFFLASVLFSFSCLLVIGRFPGQAKQMRQALARQFEEFEQDHAA